MTPTPFENDSDVTGAYRVVVDDGTRPAILQLAGGQNSAISGNSDLRQQLRNVAALPGIQGAVWALPNCGPGPAFPYGCVAATDPDEGGIVTPMAAGTDPYCGVRLMAFEVERKEGERRINELARALARRIPSGRRGILRSPSAGVTRILYRGAQWAVEQGFGTSADLERIDHGGRLVGADAAVLSPHARAIGEDQLGTLGTGKHLIEVAFVSDIMDEVAANRLGLRQNQLVVWLHAGCRGLGQQVMSEYQRVMSRAAARHMIRLPDRQLFCAPIHSHEGREYLAAMATAANFAFASRQILAHRIYETMAQIFGGDGGEGSARTVYEQCHNTVSLEVQIVNGMRKRLCVHRRAAGRTIDLLNPATAQGGQPVFLLGHCSTASFAGLATERAPGLAMASLPVGCGFRGQDVQSDQGTSSYRPTTLLIHMQQGRQTTYGGNPYREVEPLSETLEGSAAVRWAVRTRPLAVLHG